jgi:endonuclease/exonuclease/phosphatase family metal-dependent hydrolase
MRLNRRRSIIAGLVALIVAVGIFATTHKYRAGDAGGVRLEGTVVAAATRPASVKIATYNIHSGRSEAGKADLELTARTLEGFDVIALNEAAGTGVFGGEDQAEQLGRRLQMMWLYAPSERRMGMSYFGNGLLSRFPASQWQRTQLASVHEPAKRSTLYAELDVGAAKLHLLVAHVARQADHDDQLRLICQRFLSLPTPAVLIGDLNTERSDAILQGLLQTPGVTDAVGPKEPRRIDWIVVRGAKVMDAGSRDLGASDHPMYWAEISLGD